MHASNESWTRQQTWVPLLIIGLFPFQTDRAVSAPLSYHRAVTAAWSLSAPSLLLTAYISKRTWISHDRANYCLTPESVTGPSRGAQSGCVFLALPEVPVFLTGLKSVQVRQRKAQFWFNCRLHSPAEAKHIFTDGGFWKLSNMFLGFHLSSLWWKAKGATRRIYSNWSIMHQALQDLFWQLTGAITGKVKVESITQVQEANNMVFFCLFCCLGLIFYFIFLLIYLIFTHVKNVNSDRLLDLFKLKLI